MHVHPEMKAALDEEMREGLKWYKKTTPEEIKTRFDKRMIAQQRAIIVPKDLVGKKIWDCHCLSNFIGGHAPWCDQTYKIELQTEPELPKGKLIDGRVWYSGGHSPWGMI